MQPQKASQKLRLIITPKTAARLLTNILVQKQTATVCFGSTLFA